MRVFKISTLVLVFAFLASASRLRAEVADPDKDLPHLPYDAAGWTQFASDYAVKIYADSLMGDDANDGHDVSVPVKNLVRVEKLLSVLPKTANAIRIYLKRGGDWSGQELTINRSGTASHPILVDGWSYGSPSLPAPQLEKFRVWMASHVAAVGLVFPFRTRTTVDTAISVTGSASGSTDILLEDVHVSGYWQNIIAGGSAEQPLTNFRMRRSVSQRSYDPTYLTQGMSKPQGIFLAQTVGGLLEENLFYHNAYLNDDYSDATAYGHDIYCGNSTPTTSCFDVRLRANFVARGLQAVKGPATGEFENNLIYQNANGGYIGSLGGSFHDNLVLNELSRAIGTNHIGGKTNNALNYEGGFNIQGPWQNNADTRAVISAWAAKPESAARFSLASLKLSGRVLFQKNIFSQGDGAAFSIDANQLVDFVFSNNIVHNFNGGINSSDVSTRAVIQNNDFQIKDQRVKYDLMAMFRGDDLRVDTKRSKYTFGGNTCYSPAGASAPLARMGAYDYLSLQSYFALTKESPSSFRKNTSYLTADLGDYIDAARLNMSVDDFIDQMLEQSRFTWKQEYRVPVINNFFRTKAYGLTAVPVRFASGVSAPPSSPTPVYQSIDDAAFAYSGIWLSGADAAAFKGANHWTTAPQSFYTVTFTGTRFRIIGSRAPNYGWIGISIDGGAEQYVDLYRAQKVYQDQIFESAALKAGTHQVKVRLTSVKNASSSATHMAADRLDFLP